ncbi:MAG TPA: roadblock/LC7 domain-containing protein [Rugosimonospora sp.]|nr:roadblock/LC7 domain-containing protein [Rugosimonospora sp.]
MDDIIQELRALRERVTGVQGCVIAGVDGLLLMWDTAGGQEPHDLAALAAAAVGVGRQAGLALRHGGFRETTIHSLRGYFTVYAVGESALLAVVGDDGMNVARLHLEARTVAPRLAAMLQATRPPQPELPELPQLARGHHAM